MNSNRVKKPQTALLWAYGLKTISQFLFYVLELVFSGFAVAGYICVLSVWASNDFQNFKVQTQVVKTMIVVLLLVAMSLFLSKVFTRIFKNSENTPKEVISIISFLIPLLVKSNVPPKLSNPQELEVFGVDSLKLVIVNSIIVLLVVVARKLTLKFYNWFIIQKVLDKSSVEIADENSQQISKFGMIVLERQLEDDDVRKIEQIILKDDYKDVVFIEKIDKEQSLSSCLGKETQDKSQKPKLYVGSNSVVYTLSLSLRFGKDLGWYIPLTNLLLSHSSWGINRIRVYRSNRPLGTGLAGKLEK